MIQTKSEVLPINPESPWLAPLAGYTDLPFRVICRENGAAVTCTEMVSAKGLVYSARSREAKRLQKENDSTVAFDSATEELLLTTPLEGFPVEAEADSPLVVQLFGEEAEFLAEAAKLLQQRGFKWIDLNMGCSVPKVVRTGAGAALLKNEKNISSIAKALIGVFGAGKVGFKFRLGWDSSKENYLEVAKLLEGAGAGWLTLHPRFAKQGFSGKANWDALESLKKAVSIPVIASGDLFSASDAVTCLKNTGVDTVMFARGAMENPAIFAKYKQMLLASEILGQENAPDFSITPARLEQIILRHAELSRAFYVLTDAALEERRKHQKNRKNNKENSSISRIDGGLLKMRSIIPRYLRDLPGCKALRVNLVHCLSWQEFYDLIGDFFQNNIADTLED